MKALSAATQDRHLKWLHHHVRLTKSRARRQETEGPVKQAFADSLAQSRRAWPDSAFRQVLKDLAASAASSLQPYDPIDAQKPISRCLTGKKKTRRASSPTCASEEQEEPSASHFVQNAADATSASQLPLWLASCAPPVSGARFASVYTHTFHIYFHLSFFFFFPTRFTQDSHRCTRSPK